MEKLTFIFATLWLIYYYIIVECNFIGEKESSIEELLKEVRKS